MFSINVNNQGQRNLANNFLNTPYPDFSQILIFPDQWIVSNLWEFVKDGMAIVEQSRTRWVGFTGVDTNLDANKWDTEGSSSWSARGMRLQTSAWVFRNNTNSTTKKTFITKWRCRGELYWGEIVWKKISSMVFASSVAKESSWHNDFYIECKIKTTFEVAVKLLHLDWRITEIGKLNMDLLNIDGIYRYNATDLNKVGTFFGEGHFDWVKALAWDIVFCELKLEMISTLKWWGSEYWQFSVDTAVFLGNPTWVNGTHLVNGIDKNNTYTFAMGSSYPMPIQISIE